MGCLEQSTASSRTGGTKNGSSTVNVDESVAAADTPRQAEEIATLAEKLALELAEIFSPKELHIMALEHLHAYSETRCKQGCCLLPVVSIFRRVVSLWSLSCGGSSAAPKMHLLGESLEEKWASNVRSCVASESYVMSA